MRVRKRDGKVQQFDRDRIKRAMLAAFHDVRGKTPDVGRLVDQVENNCYDDIDVESIQNLVEGVLIGEDQDVARAYMRYRDKRAEERALHPDPNLLSDYIFASKYRRGRETKEEMVSRVYNMHAHKVERLSLPMEDKRSLQDRLSWAFGFVNRMEVLPSMRSMQFGGAAAEDRNARMFNCTFTHVDRRTVFSEILYLLLCGCGCGYSVQFHHVDNISTIKGFNKDHVKHFVVPDSIEGWAMAVQHVIDCAISGYYPEFAYHRIRPEGAALKTTGGRAPGHLPLKRAIENMKSILDGATGRRLRPIECHDIICHLASAVLAGGIRRSSLLSLFSPDDGEMMQAKTMHNFTPEGIPGATPKNVQRQNANNSAVFHPEDIRWEQFSRLFDHIQDWGEPGLFFTHDLEHGPNPCCEIDMDPRCPYFGTGFGFCNLTEINVATVRSRSDFLDRVRAATIIGTMQASYTDFKYLSRASKEIAERDALLGVSLTGCADNDLSDELLREGAEAARQTNEYFARDLGINPAKRICTIKPSGTASLYLGGVGSGIHPHHSSRYFRRVTANPLESAASEFRRINPHMVDIKPNGDLSLVFPMETNGKTIDDETDIEFLERVLKYYRNWVTPGANEGSHNVSATVTVDNPEDVKQWVWEHRHELRGLSFAPRISDKQYPFVPRERVTEQDEHRWRYYLLNQRPVDFSDVDESADKGDACEGPSCEI